MEAQNYSPIVKVIPLQPHSLAFGGFEVQMLAAIRASSKCGVEISSLNFWDKKNDFNILHVWGFDLQHFNSIKWAKLSGKKVVLSGLFPYRTPVTRLRHLVSSYLGPGILRNKMLKWIDIITVVNDEQKKYVNTVLGYPIERIQIVPNIVEDVFFITEQGHSKEYVLCVGNICHRKNQVLLAKACKRLNLPLVLVGNVLPGDEEYGLKLKNELLLQTNAIWYQGIESMSSDLIEIYRGAKIFALPSHEETQPISVLESLAGQIPVVIGNRPYAKQDFFAHSILVNPNSLRSIERGIKKIFTNSEAFAMPHDLMGKCREIAVGKAYRDIYERVISESSIDIF